ncbi:MAG: hypothetical protein ACYS3N_09035 [Planctomycetota bacterium]|jgi:hypothetical protein
MSDIVSSPEIMLYRIKSTAHYSRLVAADKNLMKLWRQLRWMEDRGDFKSPFSGAGKYPDFAYIESK